MDGLVDTRTSKYFVENIESITKNISAMDENNEDNEN